MVLPLLHCRARPRPLLGDASSLARPLSPQAEWRGQYVVMLVASSCTPFAASVSFEAGPPAMSTSPFFHVHEPPVAVPGHTKWWPSSMERPCTEMSILNCPELTIHISNRGNGAHERDALLLLPVSAAMATPVRGAPGAWRDLLGKYRADRAAASNILVSTRQNVTLRIPSPMHRTTYVAVLLPGGDTDAVSASHEPVVSGIFVAGRNTGVGETRDGWSFHNVSTNMTIDVEERSDRPHRRQPLVPPLPAPWFRWTSEADDVHDSRTTWTDVRVSVSGRSACCCSTSIQLCGCSPSGTTQGSTR